MVSLMQRRREMMLAPSGGSTPSVNDYVQDGLFLFLDGIQNTRNGHDTSSLAWEDLSGNNRDVTYGNTKVLGDYYCIPNKLITTSFAIAKTYTLEFVLDMASASTTNPFCIICPTSDAPNACNYDEVTDEVVFGTKTSTTGYRIPRVNTISTYNSQGYVNGSSGSWSAPGSGWTWSYPSTTKLFGYSNTAKRVCQQKICAVRLYNRELTAAEIAQNAQIDIVRFRPYRT